MANGTDQQAITESAEDFSERITAAIDNAGLTLLLSIGHQTGLFDAMAKLPSATSAEIAEAAGLDERYVREWLGGMAAGRVVDYDAEASTYRLPGHRAAALTRDSGLGNLARLAQYVPLMCEVEQKILGCFRDGGGLSYDDYPRFHTVMAERSGEVFDAALVDVVLPLVDGLPSAARRRHRRRGLRMRQRIRDRPHGPGLSGEPIHRHRLLRGGDRHRSRPGSAAWIDQRLLPARRPGRTRRDRGIRPHHGIRCDPRPGAAGPGAGEHLSRAAAGRGCC
ncbi:hypothetical protein ATO49_03355 [Mycolicibacterium fortuitum subsp. fortuitum DSM 46621 = ATCC 6841 = JCM 6387]|nr:hypothetical protein ATO49_03355 [Mycolicibacterium fortuitum subsp. fortuitum DSM 46621 = ATCC 6841 = JCM 6387]